MALISSSPMAAPWMPSVPCLVGSGQPMMVSSLMMEGLSVTLLAASMASWRAWTSSS